MRVAISLAILFGLALLAVVIVVVIKKVQRRRNERLQLLQELDMLRRIFTLIQDEVNLQIQADHFDITAFRHILNDFKELLP